MTSTWGAQPAGSRVRKKRRAHRGFLPYFYLVLSALHLSAFALLVVAACEAPAPAPSAEPAPVSPDPHEEPGSTPALAPPSPTNATTEASHAESGTLPIAPPASASGSPSAAPSAKPKPRPKRATCAEGAYRHDEPAFCLRVPDGYAPTSVKSGGVLAGVLFRSNEKGTLDLEVTWLDKSRKTYDEERQRLKEAADADPDAFVGKCRDGNGLYVRYKSESGGQRVVHGHSVHYKNGTIFWCRASAFLEPPPPDGFLTACQSLMPAE